MFIFILGGVLGFWIGSQPQAAARSVAGVCDLADTAAGRLLDQHQVDRVVGNLADALSLRPEDRAALADRVTRFDPRCAQALAQLEREGGNPPPT